MSLLTPFSRARGVLVDASGFLALTSTQDAHNCEAQQIWDRIIEAHYSTFTTNFLVAETHALFLARLGHTSATDFLHQIFQSSITIIKGLIPVMSREPERLYFSIRIKISHSPMQLVLV